MKIDDKRIVIKVEAKKSVMEQVLNIERNLEQGGIIEVIIYINNEKIAFENRKSDIVYMSSDIYEINSDYELLGKKQRLG